MHKRISKKTQRIANAVAVGNRETNETCHLFNCSGNVKRLDNMEQHICMYGIFGIWPKGRVTEFYHRLGGQWSTIKDNSRVKFPAKIGPTCNKKLPT